MVYTSYFANLRKIPKSIIPISICASAPIGFIGWSYKHLAPNFPLLSHWKEHHDEDYYRKTFKEEVLDNLNPHTVLKELSIYGDDLVLICYEKPSSFCHRHLVAEWLNSAVPTLQVKEWSNLC